MLYHETSSLKSVLSLMIPYFDLTFYHCFTVTSIFSAKKPPAFLCLKLRKYRRKCQSTNRLHPYNTDYIYIFRRENMIDYDTLFIETLLRKHRCLLHSDHTSRAMPLPGQTRRSSPVHRWSLPVSVPFSKVSRIRRNRVLR